jgi:hypothetical protein
MSAHAGPRAPLAAFTAEPRPMRFPKRFYQLAALGALGVTFGTIALYALVAYISRHTDRGGIDSTNMVLTWVSVAIPIIAIAAVHLVYARVLFDEVKRAP